MTKIKYSVVVPVYNSEHTLEELFARIQKVFTELKESFEIIFVEDGGKDDSWKLLQNIKEANPKLVTAIKLSRNYGQHNATFCGFDHAAGELIITIDDDLQTPPEEIKKLINTYVADNKPDLVYGYYEKKQHSGLRNFGSKFLKLYTKIFFNAPGEGSSFRLFTAKVKNSLLNHRSTMVFIDEILLWYSGNISFAKVNHQSSEKGKSSYSGLKLFRMFINIILYSTVTPLKIMIYGGFLFSFINFIIGLFFIYRKLIYNVPLGYTSIIVTILFSTGILMFFLGIIGKYLSKIFVIQNKKPPYLVSQILNRENNSGK